MSRISGARANLLAAMPIRDIKGGTLVLGTADGSIAVPTNPRPVGVLLIPGASAESFVNIRMDTSSLTSGGYLSTSESYLTPIDSAVTNIHASVASGAGTLTISWIYAGSAG